jgi:hypothetical protein
MRYKRTLQRLVRKGRIKLVGIDQAVLLEIKQLRVSLPHVSGVLVAFAAMTAAQLGLGHQIAVAAVCGEFQETITRAANGYVATFAAGTSALLTVVASPELNVGRLHHEARPVAARVGELVAPAHGR